jgi:outer membrane protein
MLLCRAALATALAFASLPAMAQSLPAEGQAPAAVPETPVLSFGTQGGSPRTLFATVLLGVQTRPEYFGSEDTNIGPLIRPSVGFFNFAGLSFGEPAFDEDPYERKQGFGARASFRYISERNSGDFDELDGLDDIDPTLEVGLGVGYVWPNLEVFADARYGIGGADAWVGEVGANLVARPTDRLALRLGPRFLYGADRYAETYFGVTSDESARSGLAAYAPDGGLVTAGVEVIATYRIGDRWWLEGGARYDRFQGDAADSPIVRQGTEDSTQLRIGVRRAFVLEF